VWPSSCRVTSSSRNWLNVIGPTCWPSGRRYLHSGCCAGTADGGGGGAGTASTSSGGFSFFDETPPRRASTSANDCGRFFSCSSTHPLSRSASLSGRLCQCRNVGEAVPNRAKQTVLPQPNTSEAAVTDTPGSRPICSGGA